MKLKETHLSEIQREFELDLSYNEWLRDNYFEPSEKELQEMEEEFANFSVLREHTVALKPSNNINYRPDRSIK